MKKYTLADLRDLLEADGFGPILDIDPDNIEDDEAAEICEAMQELAGKLEEVLDSIEFRDMEDEYDD